MSFNCSADTVVTSSVHHPDHALSGLNAINSLLATLGNAAILVAFRSNPRLLDKSFNVLILNLTISDLAVGVLDLPWKIMLNELGFWPFDRVSCALFIYCDWGMTFVSIFTLVAISIDRYAAACWSTAYHQSKPQKRAWITVASIWLFLLVTWTPAFIIDRVHEWDLVGHCSFSAQLNRTFSIYVVFAGYHIPSVIMVLAYVRVYHKLRSTRLAVSPVTRRAPTEAPSAVSFQPTYGDWGTHAVQPITNKNVMAVNTSVEREEEIKDPTNFDVTKPNLEDNCCRKTMDDQISDAKKDSKTIIKDEANKKQPIDNHDASKSHENDPIPVVTKSYPHFTDLRSLAPLRVKREFTASSFLEVDAEPSLFLSTLSLRKAARTENTLEVPHHIESSLQVPLNIESPLEIPHSIESPLEIPHNIECPLEIPHNIESPLKVPVSNESLPDSLPVPDSSTPSSNEAGELITKDKQLQENLHFTKTSVPHKSKVDISWLFQDKLATLKIKIFPALNPIAELEPKDAMTEKSKPQTGSVPQNENGKWDIKAIQTIQKTTGRRESLGNSKELRIFKSLTLILAAYLVLWTPVQLCMDIACFFPCVNTDTAAAYMSVLCYFNSALNPFLYAIGSAEVKVALRRAFIRG